jgi:hypothetical protein
VLLLENGALSQPAMFHLLGNDFYFFFGALRALCHDGSHSVHAASALAITSPTGNRPRTMYSVALSASNAPSSMIG